MAEFGKPDGVGSATGDTLSIPWVVGAAVLCGAGLFLVINAVIELAGGLTNWLWWVGIAPLTLGFLMLLNPRAGPQGPR